MGEVEKLLRMALKNGMISVSDIQCELEKMKHEKFIGEHKNKIWQGKNGRWYTYLPNGKGGRKQVSKIRKEDLLKAIASAYHEQEKMINPTVEDIFVEWLDKKLEYNDICITTYERYLGDFKAYFGTFGQRPITDVTEIEIEDFMRSTVAEHGLTRKSYSNFRTLIYGIFRLARKKKLITYGIKDVVAEIDFSRNSFRRKPKVNNEQIFTEQEERKVVDYLENNQDTMNLALLLMFYTGLRIGEIVALTVFDVKRDRVSVSKTETRVKIDGKVSFEIKNHPKTDAGNRDVIVRYDHVWILEKLKAIPRKSEWLLEVDGRRLSAQRLRRRLYRVCDKAGVPRKSPHKVRKTYGTKLRDSGLPESIVCDQMGHTDISCLMKHYYFNRFEDDIKTTKINQTVGI